MRNTDARQSQRTEEATAPQKNSLNTKRHRSGVALIWVSIVGMLLILIIGIGVDTAKIALVGEQLQDAADAAALAGARLVKFEDHPRMQTRALAISIALLNLAHGMAVQLDENGGNYPDGDIVVGKYNRRTRTFTPTISAANALKIVARCTESSLNGPVSLAFGPIAGVETANVSRYAIAMSTGGNGAGVIALRPDSSGLYLNGNPIFQVNNGDIQVNSEDDDAVRVIGQPDVWASELNMCGYYDATGGFEFDPDLIVQTRDQGVQPIDDPLCNPTFCLPEPTWDPASDLSDGQTLKITNGAHVLEPGYYSGGFEIKGGDVTLKPGIYILGGGPKGKGGLVVAGNANLCAMGVMFYITENGKVDLAGTDNIRVTPIGAEGEPCEFCDPSFEYPDDDGFDYVYEDVTIFQDRDNHNDARIVGTALLDLDGTLYFPENHVHLTGTGDGFGNGMIVGSLQVSGTGQIIIDYDKRYNSPATGAYLVE